MGSSGAAEFGVVLAQPFEQNVEGYVGTLAAFPLEAILEVWASLVTTSSEDE
jgi:hypothetical protein